MERMINEILKYDFYLSQWFAGRKKDKIIPGTSFLFLNQISFLFVAVFLVTIKFLPFIMSPRVATAFVILVVLFITYGLQKKVQTKIRKNDYDKEYRVLTKKEIYLKRVLALLLFILPFGSCFIVAIIFYR